MLTKPVETSLMVVLQSGAVQIHDRHNSSPRQNNKLLRPPELT